MKELTKLFEDIKGDVLSQMEMDKIRNAFHKEISNSHMSREVHEALKNKYVEYIYELHFELLSDQQMIKNVLFILADSNFTHAQKNTFANMFKISIEAKQKDLKERFKLRQYLTEKFDDLPF